MFMKIVKLTWWILKAIWFVLKFLYSTLKSMLGEDKMEDEKVTFDWNGSTINFDDWSNQPPGIYEYTTVDRRHYFKFNLVKKGSEIRIYIVEQPSYGSRNSGGHPTHRLEDSKGDYICIQSSSTPTNIPHALTWLVHWSERTGRYIDTGKALQEND